MRVIDGIQFFDAEQQFLKLYEYEQEHEQQKKLTASSVVTYLLMRSQCDEAGLIYETEFNLKLVCENWACRIAQYIMAIIVCMKSAY
ncbi:hypothetical protein [Lysinibacillus sphaericus]|uniref:hypothetical protein n=1 Tax=Lysinibacillus sphaericus TaxID=1421 RepID=UPI0007897DF8|nr:hypothetical protein [Lysinibacillus sphaericus]AMR93009.1 hypothetical protein A1T07_22650 [Lysinibacillus sphaericus]